MRPLAYARAAAVEDAIALVAGDPASAFLAGGTTEVDLIRAGISRSERLVDINALPLDGVEPTADGGLRIGALARMSDVARTQIVAERFPAISRALLLGASEQLRNMASMGGNLRQRTRCAYLRDGVSPCNKRAPGSGCAALDGLNRGHAILGTSEHCIATHPSDVAVALMAFDAVVETVGPDGARAIAFDDFFLAPGDSPELEHPLAHGELIVAIVVPPAPIARRSVYLKFRDRQSYEFALVSVAAAVEVVDGRVAEARLALGGVGTKPWRARRAEAALAGAPADAESFLRAAREELVDAGPREPQRVQGRARRARGGARAHGGAAMTAVGKPLTRVEGRDKVTGAARYTAELAPRGTLDLALVGATISAGRVTAIDAEAASRAPGVVAVLDHRTLGRIAAPPHLLPSLLGQAAPGESFFPLQDDVVHYAGQPVALVVADSLERAAYAASLVRVEYASAPITATIDQGRERAYEPERLFGGLLAARNARGDSAAALASASVRVDAAFHMEANHHNPIEAPATIAYWDRDRLTLIDSTMGVRATQLTVAQLLGLPLASVRALAGFIGGSFGMKAMVWPHVTLTAMAARAVGRPVRLTLTRPQMFASNGHREEQEQRVSLGATRDGPPGRDRAPQALADVAVRRLGRARDGRQLAALCVRALHRRAPADPRQHDDADVHPRARGGARRLRARVRDGRARRRARRRPGPAAAAQPHRGRRPWARVVQRRPAGMPAARGGALRLGRARPGPALGARRRLADRHGNGRRRVPDRVLHARAARAGADLRRRQRARADGGRRVRHGRADDGDAGRRRRARRRPGRRRVPGRRQRHAQQDVRRRVRRRRR